MLRPDSLFPCLHTPTVCSPSRRPRAATTATRSRRPPSWRPTCQATQPPSPRATPRGGPHSAYSRPCSRQPSGIRTVRRRKGGGKEREGRVVEALRGALLQDAGTRENGVSRWLICFCAASPRLTRRPPLTGHFFTGYVANIYVASASAGEAGDVFALSSCLTSETHSACAKATERSWNYLGFAAQLRPSPLLPAAIRAAHTHPTPRHQRQAVLRLLEAPPPSLPISRPAHLPQPCALLAQLREEPHPFRRCSEAHLCPDRHGRH